MNAEPIELGPQKGPQSIFSKCPADIAIYGGAAGGGKSWSVLYEALRNAENPYFTALILRRTIPQITNPGGLWDESKKLYSLVNGTANNSALIWRFPSGFYIKFAGLEHEDSKLGFQGAQIPYIAFDELTHFTETQFWYMQSRNRSESGVSGYVRATTNPDPDSWVRHFIDWWIGADGFPIPERAGKLRWFIRLNDEIIWASSKKEIFDKYGDGPDILPQSVTFIPAKLEDNKILMKKDPSYKAKLLGMGRVERGRLHGGNWNIKATAGDMFARERFEIIDAIPHGWVDKIRFWDKAGTKPREGLRVPDWTVGLKLLKYPNGLYVVEHVERFQDEPGEVNETIKNIATQDGYGCKIKEQQDPGQAGKEEAQNFVRLLGGYSVTTQPFSKNKVLRAAGVRAQVHARNVKILRADWNEAFLKELDGWTGEKDETDDQVDALSGAFNELAGIASMDAAALARMARLMGG